MKSKTLVALAVASTIGWSAGAIAGSGHEVITPLSVNESGPVLVSQHQGFGHEPSSSFATSSVEHTIMGSPLSDSSDWSGSEEQVAMADDASYYIVAWTPVVMEQWDLYVVDPDTDLVALTHLYNGDIAFIDGSMSSESLALSGDDVSGDQLAMGESDFVPEGALQEDMVAYVLSVDPVEDTAQVG